MAHTTSSEFSYLRAFTEQTWHGGLKCSYGGRHFQVFFFWRTHVFLPCTGGEVMRRVLLGLVLLIQFVASHCGKGGSCKLATGPFQFLAAGWALMAV